MLTQFKSAHGNNTRDYTALGLLQNISSLQVMDLDDCAREETTEVLANPAMVDYLEAVIEMYSQENDEICREIIAKTVNLYKKHL